MLVEYIGGSVSFTMGEDGEREHVSSHPETPAKKLLADVMNRCVEFLRP